MKSGLINLWFPFELDHETMLQNLRCARRGAAPGPSGMTSEHLQHDGDGVLLCELAEQFARVSVPEEIVDALRMGRMTALQKPSGGVRGIVVGDSFRRLVARTIAQHLRTVVEEASTIPVRTVRPADGGRSVEHYSVG